MSGDIFTWFCPACKTLTLLEQALAGQCCQEPRQYGCPTPPRPQVVVEKNDWQETVRDIYDMVLTDEDPGATELALKIVDMIESRHGIFFGGIG